MQFYGEIQKVWVPPYPRLNQSRVVNQKDKKYREATQSFHWANVVRTAAS